MTNPVHNDLALGLSDANGFGCHLVDIEDLSGMMRFGLNESLVRSI